MMVLFTNNAADDHPIQNATELTHSSMFMHRMTMAKRLRDVMTAMIPKLIAEALHFIHR
jgi:hypothetical protein